MIISANSLNSAAASFELYDKSEITRKDLIKVQLDQSSSWIKPIFRELIDYQKTNDEVVEILHHRFSDLLMIEFQFNSKDTNEEKLQKLFDFNFYLPLFEDESQLLNDKNLVTQINTILKDILTFDDILKDNEVDLAKDMYREYMIQLFTQGIQYLKKNLVTQTIMLWRKYQNKSNANVKFSFNLKEELIKNFYIQINEQILQVDYEHFNDKEIADFQSTIKSIYEQEFFTFKRNLLSLTVSMFKQTFIMYETIKYSMTIVSDLVRQDQLPLNLDQIMLNSQNRITMTSKVLKYFSQKINDINFFVSLYVFMKQNTDHFRLYYSDNFDKSEIARTHLIGAQRDIFISSLDFLPLTAILDGMKLIFQSLNKADINNENIYQLMEIIKNIKKFDPRVDADKSKDIGKKLMTIDMILYFKSSEFTEEMVKLIIENYSALRTVPMPQRVQFSKTKLFFFDFNNSQRFLYNGDDKRFYIDFYLMTLTFSEFVGESSFEDMQITELFDLFLDLHYQESKTQFIQKYYLLLKIYNLFFLPENHSFETSFHILNDDSLAVKTLVEEVNKNEDFGSSLINVLQDLEDTTITTVSSKDIIQILSKHQLADDFRVFSVSFHEKDPNIKLEGNIHLNSLNASIRKESMSKESSQQNTSGNKLQSMNKMNSYRNNDNDLTLQDIISSKKTPTVSRMKSFNSNRKDSINSLQSLKRYGNVNNDNIVVETVNKLNENQVDGLKSASVNDFIDSHDVVVTKDNVQTTYVFVVLTRAKRIKYLKTETELLLE